MGKLRFFIFGDTHLPFHHRVALAIAIKRCIEYRPDVIIQAGDLHDRYSASKFSRSLNLMTPRDERNHANYYAQLLWGTLNEFLPAAQKYQILGNHCIRPIKRILDKAPEFEDELTEKLHEDYTFDFVKTIHDPSEELDIDGVRFIHGYMQGGTHINHNLMNIVCGHTHQGGVWMKRIHGNIIWELNAGYLADANHKALSYTMQKKEKKWTLGYGTIDMDGPRFCPITDKMIRSEFNDPITKKFIF